MVVFSVYSMQCRVLVCVYFVFISVYVYVGYVFFFFEQKTAYEMRISDWSSDVCSSDLTVLCAFDDGDADVTALEQLGIEVRSVPWKRDRQIGRASCRERVCQYV